MNKPTTRLRECSCSKLLVATLFATVLLAGATPTPVEARPPAEFGVGWGVTRLEWREFDETVSHYRLFASVDVASWAAVQIEYFNMTQANGPIETIGVGGITSLHLEAEAFKLGATFRWRPFERFEAYAKPAVSFTRSTARFSGGGAVEFPGGALLLPFKSNATRFAPAVGVKFRVFPRLLLGTEFEKSEIERTDSESWTFSVSVPW